MEKLKLLILAILLVILVLILGSATKLKNSRKIQISGATSGNASFDGTEDVTINTSLTSTQLTNEDLNNIKNEGFYYSAGGNSVKNKPGGVDYFGLQVKRIATGIYVQKLNYQIAEYTRFYNGSIWSSWVKAVTKGDFSVLTGKIRFDNSGMGTGVSRFNFPSGFTWDNCCAISMGIQLYGQQTFNFFGEHLSNCTFTVRFQKDYINIYAKTTNDDSSFSGEKECFIVLMKK